MHTHSESGGRVLGRMKSSAAGKYSRKGLFDLLFIYLRVPKPGRIRLRITRSQQLLGNATPPKWKVNATTTELKEAFQEDTDTAKKKRGKTNDAMQINAYGIGEAIQCYLSRGTPFTHAHV